MAPKRSNPAENPPAAYSSEEEEEEEEEAKEEEEEEEVTASEEEEDEEGSSEEEEEDEEPKTQTSAPPKKPETASAVDESDESGSDSGNESDREAHTVKPIATKPMEESSNVKRSRSKPLTSTVKTSSAKRPSESEQQAKQAKRPKKKAGEEGTASAAVVVEEVKKTGEDAKKQLFQRLFSEDDEIAVLQGMLEYFDKKVADPFADMNAFYDFVKKMIHTDVTKVQLMYKIRRLRKKFENNAGKGKKGEDRTFSKPHEQKAYELSKMIWGKEGITGKVESSAARSNAAKSNGKAKGNGKALAVSKLDFLSSPERKAEPEEPAKADTKGGSKSLGSLFDKRFGVAGLEEEVVKNGLDMIGEEKRTALEEKWKKLQIAELELFLQRSELIEEQAKLLLEFYKSEDN